MLASTAGGDGPVGVDAARRAAATVAAPGRVLTATVEVAAAVGAGATPGAGACVVAVADAGSSKLRTVDQPLRTDAATAVVVDSIVAERGRGDSGALSLGFIDGDAPAEMSLAPTAGERSVRDDGDAVGRAPPCAASVDGASDSEAAEGNSALSAPLLRRRSSGSVSAPTGESGAALRASAPRSARAPVMAGLGGAPSAAVSSVEPELEDRMPRRRVKSAAEP